MEYYADLVWTGHDAWCPMRGVNTRVIDVPDAGRYVATVRGHCLDIIALDDVDEMPHVDRYCAPTNLANPIDDMVKTLTDLGTVIRVRTAEVWESIAVALCHHPTVKRPWRTFKDLCRDFGEQVPLPNSPRYAKFPTPDVIAKETPISMFGTGLGDAAGLLQDAADSYIRHASAWTTTAPNDLIALLQTVDGITERAARLIAVDISGDFSLYPHDAEFRSWTSQISPHTPWPTTQKEFTAYWAEVTKPHTSIITALLVAWVETTWPPKRSL